MSLVIKKKTYFCHMQIKVFNQVFDMLTVYIKLDFIESREYGNELYYETK